MDHYGSGYDGQPHEREPLDSDYHYEDNQNTYDYAPQPPAHGAHDQSQQHDQYYDPPRHQTFDRLQQQDTGYSRSSSSNESGGSYRNPSYPPNSYSRHAQQQRGRENSGSRAQGQGSGQPQANVTPGADNFSEAASGGMAGIAYTVADRNARESGMEAMRSTGQVPPPPSRTQHNSGHNGYDQDPYGQSSRHHDPYAGLAPAGVHPASLERSPSREPYEQPVSSPFADDPYQGFSRRNGDPRLGMLDPTNIEDDGDDGLDYSRNSVRNSMISSHHSERGARTGIGAAAAIGGATAAGGAMGSLLGRSNNGYGQSEYNPGREKPSEWIAAEEARSRKWRWVIIIIIALVIVGAIVGGVVGGYLSSEKHGAGSDNSDSGGESAKDDTQQNGDLDINSPEIKKLLNNPDLHKVFPGIDYTPYNTQYPACLKDPPSQNNVTRDLAVLSQLTNKVRLYGTDCNQTQMLLHSIKQLKMEDEIKVWMGVWQDNNAKTNARQLKQMWDILDEYGEEPFEGIIVANEILFREQMTISTLGSLLSEVRTNLTDRKMSLGVGTSDLGDDWTAELAEQSDYVMANIHPFFAGVPATEAASWTWNFWSTKDKSFWKSDKSKNIISETGWPSAGGTDCGAASSCTDGSVAGIDEMNQFMNDWVCQALANGTNYFWFEAFDEPWKVVYNTKGKEWEDKWGLMDSGRNLKDGVKIPDCGGKTVS